MRAVIQRVISAEVEVEQRIVSRIGEGLLVLVGIEDSDSMEDLEWLTSKIVNLRIFGNSSDTGSELSVKDMDGEILAVSQFTLMAQTKKGNRPSYIRASKGDVALPIYNKFCGLLTEKMKNPVKTGIFGADMKVRLVNDGPFTIIMDTKNKE